jgi:hypothetical protein
MEEAMGGVPLMLIDLAGAVALLLWGVRMVQTGVQRAFGLGSGWPWPRRSATASTPSSPASASPPSCRAARRPDR